MSDFFKFEYIDPKNIILNKNNEGYGTIIDGTKSGININTFQQPTRLTFRNDFIGGFVQDVISFRGNTQNLTDPSGNVTGYGYMFGPSINNEIPVDFPSDSIIIYQTGQGYGNVSSKGPYIRLGYHNIISEVPDSRLGIGTLFPAEKVHISGGNLRVDGGASFSTRPTVNGTGVLLSGEAVSLPATIVYTTGNQTISGTKNFTTRPQVNNIGVVISGEAYPSNNPSGFITGVDLSSLYPRSNPSGYITGVNLSAYITTGQTGDFYPRSNPSGFITGVNLSSYATIANLNSTGSNLQNQINSLSGSAVLIYGDQTIDGTKTFRNSVYIHDLYVTGTEFIANVQNNFIESPYILLNLTGGAVDGGIFFVTGTGLTGVNDYGPIIGFDHSNKFKFGIARRSDDLSTLNDIAAVQDLTNYSGFVNNNYYGINKLLWN
jgi:hypothetical protein